MSEVTKPRNRGGRPRANINVDQLKALMRLHPSLDDTAAFLNVSGETVTAFIRREFKMGFLDFREQNAVHTRFASVRSLIKQVEKGNLGAIIWYQKNQMGWADKIETKQEISVEPVIEYKTKWGGNAEPTEALPAPEQVDDKT